ncbi:Predicted N-formylglutamate amidohydrolase [Faunimonas pinastri]|uniref:Predicted N-formylglutamate amidohydrolase n=1 Tax=Faunimonas pinastri TaxID=1855383 RepID=A0A1H9PFX1_9HYPH|nr:N-formylglutamate amidohydrolase [Faunimonas pinastri]SER47112.1 Predicted N-formylglutamate amidohydrolase [Faunimonas pinastri]
MQVFAEFRFEGQIMADPNTQSLLAPDEPAPVMVEHENGASHFFLTSDHAGRLMPRSVGDLGVPESELGRHIAWDIGIWNVSKLMADAFDSFLVGQRYSRLVIDCNRDPSVASSMPEISEETVIPGNVGLNPGDRQARIDALFKPYHNRITGELDARKGADRETVLISMHSFTPVFKGFQRPWHVGILYNRDDRLAKIVMDLLERETGLVVGDNEPYQVSDLTDYTVPVHAERRGLPHVEVEIRQDLITDEAGQREWAERFIRILPQAYERFATDHPI